MTLENLSSRIPGEMKKYLKVKAAKEGTSVQAFIIEAIKDWIEKQENGGK